MDKFQSGIHYTIYEKLGAHPMTIDGIRGVYFAVWAPNSSSTRWPVPSNTI